VRGYLLVTVLIECEDRPAVLRALLLDELDDRIGLILEPGVVDVDAIADAVAVACFTLSRCMQAFRSISVKK
jgi:hypothetical protein